jgi:hypothetical protein
MAAVGFSWLNLRKYARGAGFGGDTGEEKDAGSNSVGDNLQTPSQCRRLDGITQAYKCHIRARVAYNGMCGHDDSDYQTLMLPVRSTQLTKTLAF